MLFFIRHVVFTVEKHKNANIYPVFYAFYSMTTFYLLYIKGEVSCLVFSVIFLTVFAKNALF